MPFPPPDIKHQNKLALLRGLALVPLLLYPAVLLAGLMAIAAPDAGSIRSLEAAIGFSFIMSSLSYPLTVIICLVFNRRRSLRRASIPLWHLGLCVVLGVLWFAVS
jgi:hypothetical protein